MTLWRRLFGRGELDRELDAELRDHVDRLVAEYTARWDGSRHGAPEGSRAVWRARSRPRGLSRRARARGGSRIWSPTCDTASACSRTAGRSPSWPCCPWRWASGPTRQSSRWSTACCSTRCRCTSQNDWCSSTATRRPTRSGSRSRAASSSCSLAPPPGRISGSTCRRGARPSRSRGCGQAASSSRCSASRRSSAGRSPPRTIAAAAAPTPRSL